MKLNKKVIFITIIFILFIVISVFIYKIFNNDKNIKLDDINKYIEGYNLYKYLYEVEGNEIILAPEDFDKDSFDNYKDFLVTYELSDNLEIYNYKEETFIKNNKITSHKVVYDDIKRSDFDDLINDNGGISYIWLNEDNKINKIVLYGTLTVYE